MYVIILFDLFFLVFYYVEVRYLLKNVWIVGRNFYGFIIVYCKDLIYVYVILVVILKFRYL